MGVFALLSDRFLPVAIIAFDLFAEFIRVRAASVSADGKTLAVKIGAASGKSVPSDDLRQLLRREFLSLQSFTDILYHNVLFSFPFFASTSTSFFCMNSILHSRGSFKLKIPWYDVPGIFNFRFFGGRYYEQ